jgi:hypothetical protein
MRTATRKPTTSASVYDQLESLCLPHIEAYHADLTTHDRKFIADNPDVPFLHFTRSCGTHIAPLIPAEQYPRKGERIPYLFGTADREHVLDGTKSIVSYAVRSEVTQLAIYYDGARVRVIEPAKALEIVDRYAAGIRRQWQA